MDPSPVANFGRSLSNEVGQVIVGKSDVVELLAVALLCEGHVLIEDVPGIGKTMMAKSLARSLACSFSRVQFTPDLLPSDVTGIFFYNQKSGDFEFRSGPIHANVILADEINRATPRTQSSLLEAMEERQVTVEGHTSALPRPFIVLATQNPVELEGTFPLPEAQLDRFLLRLSVGYPTDAEEVAILRRFESATPLDDVRPVLGGEQILDLIDQTKQVHVDDSIAEYIVSIARATRRHEAIELGASPRASLALFHASQALAALRERAYVTPDDVKRLVGPVFAHRLILRHQGRLRGSDVRNVLTSIVEATPTPVEPLPVTT
ncbi:MAG: AAA family ATPase [Candidatus Handelsmanbacteria bacterium RIFCSPLOWO2_12_FULL_64_10]|uniref:AAA family ATPase n=1 Tax=Handelsmanbacteria sp. (strain RIFCSPLOWO2_12_FULL_64_10) TaxID=1817868 RepID=A0A1F6CSB5_HANXR|nr:MAG: AAA family ATPase [Candidatus Handelsmanbacteria bacterium RIFCSPLOWO2_12_FULL_64_10]